MISRCDSAAMVPNTSDDLPDPETPVNTVSRRLGISTVTSFRLFTRAPWTRIRSWLSAGSLLEEAMFAIMKASSRLHFFKPADQLSMIVTGIDRASSVVLLIRKR